MATFLRQGTVYREGKDLKLKLASSSEYDAFWSALETEVQQLASEDLLVDNIKDKSGEARLYSFLQCCSENDMFYDVPRNVYRRYLAALRRCVPKLAGCSVITDIYNKETGRYEIYETILTGEVAQTGQSSTIRGLAADAKGLPLTRPRDKMYVSFYNIEER